MRGTMETDRSADRSPHAIDTSFTLPRSPRWRDSGTRLAAAPSTLERGLASSLLGPRGEEGTGEAAKVPRESAVLWGSFNARILTSFRQLKISRRR